MFQARIEAADFFFARMTDEIQKVSSIAWKWCLVTWKHRTYLTAVPSMGIYHLLVALFYQDKLSRNPAYALDQR